jgi:hypothetical protein
MFLLLALACTAGQPDDSSVEATGDGLTYVTIDYDCDSTTEEAFTFPQALPMFVSHFKLEADTAGDAYLWAGPPSWRPGATWTEETDANCATDDLGGRIVFAYRADE